MSSSPHVERWNDGRIYAAEASASMLFAVSCWSVWEVAPVAGRSLPLPELLLRACVAGMQGRVMGCALVAYVLLLWQAGAGRVPAPFRA
jgi:hypothetical protein